ncbi:MAG TPA: vitamin K epoxide reductase family protein [Planctomycetaceae bacterium]|nr:vitamin K epoxide reductase family protein [Planctomycetaceae bacterium]
MAATFESFKHPWPLFPGGGGVAPLPRPFVWLMRFLCCAALGVTGYLAATALQSQDVAGCGSGAVFDCGFVLHSRWSKFFSLPVSVPAFGLYAVVLTALAFCRAAATKSHLRVAWGIVTVGAIAAGLAALWFISLQVFAVGHLCIYCIAAHACGLALCLAILWKHPLGARMTARLAGVSVLCVSLLIATQVFSAPPQTFTVERYPTGGAVNTPSTLPASNTTPKQQNKSKAEVFEPPSGVPDDAGEN